MITAGRGVEYFRIASTSTIHDVHVTAASFICTAMLSFIDHEYLFIEPPFLIRSVVVYGNFYIMQLRRPLARMGRRSPFPPWAFHFRRKRLDGTVATCMQAVPSAEIDIKGPARNSWTAL